MPIIVDKEKKRESIALACRQMLLEGDINTLTISAIAKEAGIGKGTFYEYFANKEELLFTLVEILMRDYNGSQEQKLSTCATTREKIKCFAGFFYEKESRELRVLYKKFIGISLLHENEEMRKFQTGCLEYYYVWFTRLIEEGIAKGEIIPQTQQMAKGLFAMAKGMFLMAETTDGIDDLQEEIEHFTDELFDIVERRA